MRTVPLAEMTPPLPPGLSFPFYYASLQCLWVYWRTPIEAAEAALARSAAFDTGLEVTRFTDDGGTAGAVLNFQRYTAHLPEGLATTNEVEFNLLCHPRSAPLVPELGITDYIEGVDQTRSIGQLRLHVAADNEFAVWAGRKGFGENKFYAKFLYRAPTLNDPTGDARWTTTPYEPGYVASEQGVDRPREGRADQFLYSLEVELARAEWSPCTPTPLTEFALGLGRTVVTRWTLLGTFRTCALDGSPGRRTGFRLGPAAAATDPAFRAMHADLAALVEGQTAIAAQVFESPPACAEPPGYFLDPQ